MSMKQTILVPALVVLIGGALLAGCQDAERASSETPRPASARADITPAQEQELERIATLGYVTAVEPLPARRGVLRHDADQALAGFTLYTSAEAPYAVLIDMDGNVAHSWQYPGSHYWARVHLFENGDLLAITAAPSQLLFLDRDSELLWRAGGHIHHDMAAMSNGSVWVPVRLPVTRPYLNSGEAVLDDYLVRLDSEGNAGLAISLLEAFERSELGGERLVEWLPADEPDIFHTNSVQILTRDGRRQLLLSIRTISTVAILDIVSREIVWALSGPWHMQHEAQLVDGNLILFDNLGLTKTDAPLDQSRVLELDFDSHEVVWSFTEPALFTKGAGAQQRLVNGNTLITDSEGGRIIEVSPEGAVVWEYINTATVEGDQDMLPVIMRAERLPADLPSDWFAGDRR